MVTSMKKTLRWLYKNSEGKELLEAQRATTTFLHIASWLQGMDMDVGGIYQKREFNDNIDGQQRGIKYDYELNQFPKSSPIGIIRILEPAERSDEILTDEHLRTYNFCIIEGADTKGGLAKDKKRKDYALALTNGGFNLEPHWKSYGDFCNEFAREHEFDYHRAGLEIDKDLQVDRIVLEGRDDKRVSNARIFLEIGRKIRINSGMPILPWIPLRERVVSLR